MNLPKHIGNLKSGEGIYVDAENNILIEKEHRFLVTATADEWKEANRIWSQRNHAEALNHAGIDRASVSACQYGRKDKAGDNHQVQ
jgi:hypothetical protein